jgi:hypothetical protein
MQHNVPYTPRKNGVIKRNKHTLNEMIKCMIQSKGLSPYFWAETINCANYIVNHTPKETLKDTSLEETWSRIKLDVSHFYVFGSEAWAHILDEKRKSLQPKSEKCIFVGCFGDVKGYTLLQPHSNEIIIKRYVKFDEGISAYRPNLASMSSSTHNPSLTIVSSSIPNFFTSASILVSSSDDDN